ncbi:MAG: glutamate--cysteine ligase [Gammaproteobacteria bacterium]|nr:glutamate--cysteine ligase [Gammaproteobacteria bacterium]MYF27304.1 glutamate--cysteine ligase [Gammaproteobacteria bacterium]MYK45320.1 glutamate--cysteine ligase [Gammaproteobacteria bacterium]
MAELPDSSLAAIRGRAELGALRRGIEKESLRVTPAGVLAKTRHPVELGSALTHPHITMDFSEAQLELITGVHPSAEAALAELADVHRFVYSHLGDELLWAASMPCMIGRDDNIPIAQFGTSNAGKSKTVYRNGLSHRYGRLMQTISGIHYNFSVPEALWPAIAANRNEAPDRDFVTQAYFGLIRNFRRYSWLLVYLFGASPAVCKSFIRNTDSGLAQFDEGSLYLPHATSLRMGRLGYQSDAQSSVHISYNSLAEYAETMFAALTEPYPPYEAAGVKVGRGYRQLSTTLLQIENEFYGAIRPKRRTRSGERPLEALYGRGVEYVEVRCLDLNPFLSLGIDADICRFLDVFLLLCLLVDSPPDSRAESESMVANQLGVVERGREPSLELAEGDVGTPLVVWADRLLGQCARVADEIDAVTGGADHANAVDLQRRKVMEPDLTPSARVLNALRQQRVPFFRFAMNQSAAHRGYFEEHPLGPERAKELTAMSEESQSRQARIERSDQETFEAYLKRFLELDIPR